MDNKKWGIIFCPKSGAFRTKKRWQKVEDALRENGIDYDHVQSETRDSVGRLVKMFINNGYRTIVIVGGDSAMNDAVNCLMQIEASEREQIALGVIPNGPLNDFARFWGIHEDRCGVHKIYKQERRGVPTLFPQLREHRARGYNNATAS